MWIWYVDRGAALVALVALWVATLTGILHGARAFGPLRDAARRAHAPASVVATVALFAHVAAGAVDTGLVLRGSVPHPLYSDAYLLVGVLVGALAVAILVTSTLAFLDAKRFERPWEPKVVHALSYAGFAFAAIHAVALGSDLVGFFATGVAAATGLLLWALFVRTWAARGDVSSSPTTRASDPRGGR